MTVLQALLGALITWVFIADNTGLDLEEQASLPQFNFWSLHMDSLKPQLIKPGRGVYAQSCFDEERDWQPIYFIDASFNSASIF